MSLGCANVGDADAPLPVTHMANRLDGAAGRGRGVRLVIRKHGC